MGTDAILLVHTSTLILELKQTNSYEGENELRKVLSEVE